MIVITSAVALAAVALAAAAFAAAAALIFTALPRWGLAMSAIATVTMLKEATAQKQMQRLPT